MLGAGDRRVGRLANANLQGAQNVGRKLTSDLSQDRDRVWGKRGVKHRLRWGQEGLQRDTGGKKRKLCMQKHVASDK